MHSATRFPPEAGWHSLACCPYPPSCTRWLADLCSLHPSADGAGRRPHHHGSQHWDVDHQHLRGAHAGRRPDCVQKVRGSEPALATIRPIGSGQVAMNYLLIANENTSILPGSLITLHSECS